MPCQCQNVNAAAGNATNVEASFSNTAGANAGANAQTGYVGHGVCPHCGRCPQCGQPYAQPYYPYPYYPYPYYPYGPYYQGPYWYWQSNTCCATGGGGL